uniref:Uncharacterized protein n=1 Tax=Anguilla anguilla TaxID=7936 RepID=A0A0E9UH58_ANGAN
MIPIATGLLVHGYENNGIIFLHQGWPSPPRFSHCFKL